MTMHDDTLLRTVLKHIVKAIADLRAAQITVPLALFDAAAAISNELDMQQPAAFRPMGQS